MKNELFSRESGTPGEGAAPVARTPRYEEIHRQLVNDIRDGRYPVGGMPIPQFGNTATFSLPFEDFGHAA